MMHDVALAESPNVAGNARDSQAVSNKSKGNHNILKFVRQRDEQNMEMEKLLKQYINLHVKSKLVIEFVNRDEISDGGKEVARETLYEKQKALRAKKEEELIQHPLVQTILNEHEKGYVKR